MLHDLAVLLDRTSLSYSQTREVINVEDGEVRVTEEDGALSIFGPDGALLEVASNATSAMRVIAHLVRTSKLSS